MRTAIPAYQEMLDSFHGAFEKELRIIIDHLPLHGRDVVVDVGCGDGFYTELLADHLSRVGRLIGLDKNPAFVEMCRARFRGDRRTDFTFLQGDARAIPLPNNSVDFVWCAQSFFSFTNPVLPLQEMFRVLKPGGRVAVLEDDTLHQVVLPWPPRLELLLRDAEMKAFFAEESNGGKFYIGRNLIELLVKTGFTAVKKRTFTGNRIAPLETDTERFVRLYLKNLTDRVSPYLDPAVRRAGERFLSPNGKNDMLKDPSFSMTYIEDLVIGQKPRA